MTKIRDPLKSSELSWAILATNMGAIPESSLRRNRHPVLCSGLISIGTASSGVNAVSQGVPPKGASEPRTQRSGVSVRLPRCAACAARKENHPNRAWAPAWKSTTSRSMLRRPCHSLSRGVKATQHAPPADISSSMRSAMLQAMAFSTVPF
jgi:hypothetical protein